MTDELTDLLPLERQQALDRSYRLRFGTVVLSAGTVLIAIAAVLLVPTYLFLSGQMGAKQAQLAALNSSLASSDEVALATQLATLANETATLAALGKNPSTSAIIRAALAVSRSGITLAGLTYTPATSKKPGVLVLTGTATTRDALRAYQLALQSAPFAASAALPVSAYASDSDIAFTVTITLAP